MFPQLLDGTLHVTVGGFHYPRNIRIHSIRISLQQLNLAVKDDPEREQIAPGAGAHCGNSVQNGSRYRQFR